MRNHNPVSGVGLWVRQSPTGETALPDEQIHLLNSNLATKENLLTTKADLEHKMELLKASLEQKMEANKASLFKWMIGAIITQTMVLATLIVIS
ncbi:MAG: hypothetical protein OXI88_01105 [Gammaproteobacteria bacterium]|nr:hypothetical protein [Gammaproteobacteria bacterium]MDE0284154.1 hypothetical protein [Gammaproteobacteria bacterium]MDE0510374.1 hypothetical protein [Gammaproteobacteria bacterium]